MPWEGDLPQDRGITRAERGYFMLMLEGLPNEFRVYKQQLEGLNVTGTCKCLCGTIEVEPRSDAPVGPHARAVIGDGEAEFKDDEGVRPSSVIVFINNGKLSLLEFVRYVDGDMTHPSRVWTKEPRELPHGILEKNQHAPES